MAKSDSVISLKLIGHVKNRINGRNCAKKEWRKIVSKIIIVPELTEALEKIDRYSHIWVIFWMHKISEEEKKSLVVYPVGFSDLPVVGVLGLRAPFRPNPIGLTLVELIKKDGNVLEVRGLDAFNGTPVIDIKPYTGHANEKTDNFSAPSWANSPL